MVIGDTSDVVTGHAEAIGGHAEVVGGHSEVVGAFSPSDIAGMVDRFRATVGVTQAGGLVSSWATPTASGPVTAAGGLRPTYNATGINGRPSLTFAGAQMLDRASSPLTGAQARTVFVVFKSSGSGGPMCCYGKDGNWFGPSFFQPDAVGGTIALLTPAGFGTFIAGDGTVYAGIPMIGEYSYPGGGAAISLTLNGVAKTITGANGGTDSADRFTVGNYYNGGPGGVPFMGEIGEIITYDTNLSAGNKTLVRTALASDWGIAL